MRAGIYVRISDDREGRALGVARQEKDCRALARRKGWAVRQVYRDNDISAAKPRRKRPAYEQMLNDVRAGEINAVVTWDLDRLHRRPIELETFFEACDTVGLRHLATVGGDVDLSTGEGLLVARIKGAVAAEEVRKLRARVRRKAEELAEAGELGGGGSRPFGYKADRVTIEPKEAKLIRHAAERLLAGESLRGVVVDWNARGVLTSTGKPWSLFPFKRLMCSGRISGRREHHGEIVVNAVWPGIISAEQSDRLRTLLRSRRGSVATPRRYLLTGMLVCGRCGSRLVARPREDKQRTYFCARGPGFHGCNQLRCLAEPLEDEICEQVLATIDTPAVRKALRRRDKNTNASGITKQLRTERDALEQLSRDHYADRVIGRAEYFAARKPIQDRIASLERELGQIRQDDVLEGMHDGVRVAWNGLSLHRRRAVIDLVVDHVVLGPAVRGRNFFDPTRVEVVWKV